MRPASPSGGRPDWVNPPLPPPPCLLPRFPTGQQLVTKLVTAPMACGAVMVPTSMFMGQVVTAYNPFSGQQVRSLLPVCL